MLNDPAYHINVHDPKAVDYYCRHFPCTPDELLDAVHKIGTCVEELRIFIQHAGYSSRYAVFRMITVENVVKKGAAEKMEGVY